MPSLSAVPIRTPYVDWILDGKKTWEIRSRSTNIRGRVALIRSKSLTVVGTCEIVDVVGPLSEEDVRRHARRKMNLSPDDAYGAEGCYAWVLEDVRRLKTPVPYKHPSGAVTWVKLDGRTASRVLAAPAKRVSPGR
jgi:hypothetical protein